MLVNQFKNFQILFYHIDGIMSTQKRGAQILINYMVYYKGWKYSFIYPFGSSTKFIYELLQNSRFSKAKFRNLENNN